MRRGLAGDAAVVGIAEWPAQRRSAPEQRRLHLEQWADLAAEALDDAGLSAGDVNGLVCSYPALAESADFMPATIAEYLGWSVAFAERVDLGGASAAGAVWRAAAAIELGLCDVVVCACPGRARPRPSSSGGGPRQWRGASAEAWGSPQAEFEVPYGNVAQNCGYALIAQRYAAEYGYDEVATAKIVVDQRTNAGANPSAIFHGSPITVAEVLSSKMIADPLRLLEIVMPVEGGAAVVIASAEKAAALRRRRHPYITGFGEQVTHKSPTFAPDLVRSPITEAAERAFRMAGLSRSDVDVAQLYDCYTITVLLSIEDAGFCAKGAGMRFVRDHDLTWRGDFPLNTNGGLLGFGQPRGAAGMVHVIEGVRQVRGEAEGREVGSCDVAFVSGTGGILGEQVALILEGR